MTQFLDVILVIMVITSFLLLGSSRLATCIRIVSLQGILVGLMPFANSRNELTVRIALIGAVIIVLKGFVFPKLLFRAIRESATSREVQPFVGYLGSIFVGVFTLIGAFWMDSGFDLAKGSVSGLVVPVSFFIMVTGIFLIVARKTAVNQVVGYLMMENGIYAFGLAIASEIPVLVELGVLLDMFVAVFVMGIAIYRINREFDHIDSDQLKTLKG